MDRLLVPRVGEAGLKAPTPPTLIRCTSHFPEKRPRLSGRRIWLKGSVLVLGLSLLSLIVFWPVMGFDFVNWDDDTYIRNNPNVNGGLTWGAVRWAFESIGYQGNFTPLAWISHMLDVQLFRLDPWGHHLTSVTLHTLNAAILFLVLFRMTSALWRSALVAALFAVHPLHVESVAWISERKDVLSTFFEVLALAAYLHYAARPKVLRYLLVLVFFALGLLSKPMIFTLPGIVLLLDFWPLGRWVPGKSHPSLAPALLLEKVPLLCMAGATGVLAYVAQERGGTIASVQGTPMGLRVANSLVAYAEYLQKTVLPRGLAFLYPYPEVGIPLWKPFLAAAVLVLISIVVIVKSRQHPYLPAGWLWYLGTLLPVAGLVQIGSFSMADRFTYVPLIGVFIMAVWGSASLARFRKRRMMIATLAFVAAVVALAVTARIQSGTWRNDFTLFEHAIAVTADNWLAHNTLALSLAENGRFQEAIRHYEESLRIKPKYSSAHYNLGQVLLRVGKADQAVEHLKEAVRYAPKVEMYRSNLRIALAIRDRRNQRFPAGPQR